MSDSRVDPSDNENDAISRASQFIFQNARHLLVNRNLDDYYDKELISSNQGNVYNSRLIGDESKEWKILKILLFNQVGEEKAKNEINKLLELNHPSIVKINKMFTYISEDKLKKICFEMGYFEKDLLFWIKGQDQRNIVNKDKYDELIIEKNEVDNNRIKTIFKKISERIAYFHEKGIIHRDLKPQNIVVSDFGNHVKIIDFGIAADANITATKSFQGGSERYKSNDNKITQSSDVFSFGLMLFEFLFHPDFVNVGFIEESREQFSKDKLELLDKLLEPDSTKRISAKEALSMEFFSFTDESCILRKIVNQEKYFKWKDQDRNDIVNCLLLHPLIDESRNLVELLRNTSVKFIDENGLDDGGLSNELFSLFPELFSKSKYVAMLINGSFLLPTDDIDCKLYYFNLGKLYARYYFKRQIIKLPFGPLIFYLLLKEKKSIDLSFDELKYFVLLYYESFPELNLLKEDTDFSSLRPEDYPFIYEGKEFQLTKQNIKKYLIWKMRIKLFGSKYREEHSILYKWFLNVDSKGT